MLHVTAISAFAAHSKTDQANFSLEGYFWSIDWLKTDYETVHLNNALDVKLWCPAEDTHYELPNFPEVPENCTFIATSFGFKIVLLLLSLQLVLLLF